MNLPGLDSVFHLIWSNSLRACVLIIAVQVVQVVAGKRLPARFCYALSLLVLLRLIAPVTPASSWSVFNLTRHVRPASVGAPFPNSAASPTAIVMRPSNYPLAGIKESSRPSLGLLAAGIWLCGGAVFLLAVYRRGVKFARWVAQLPTATDPRLLELVEQCKGEAGLRRAIRIACAPKWNTAAVFGFRRPCLLLPESMLDTLERREARLVLLHELIHIRRRDVLVNWLGVLALALHWFNPLAWVAMRRLRADQELACDAEVLGLIEQADRGAYGRTLLKHLSDFPAARMAAGLVPLIASRHNIKKRISMITEFKRTSGLARGLFAVLLVALGGLTFTRAADDPQPTLSNTVLPSTAVSETPLARSSTATPPPRAGRDYAAEYVNQSTLLEQLQQMEAPGNRRRFIQILSVTASDPILNSLLEQEMAEETKLASFKKKYPPASQPVLLEEQTELVNDLKQKLDERANAIMTGMSFQVAALKAAAKNAPDRAPSLSEILSHRLEDWDHQRVAAEADYMAYSNILFNLNNVPIYQLGAAIRNAYAYQVDPELISLADRVQIAKAEMVAITNSYGAEMPAFKTAKKQLDAAQIAYQNKIDAVMEGIRTRVNEDKGFLQIIQQKEDEIMKEKNMEAQKNLP